MIKNSENLALLEENSLFFNKEQTIEIFIENSFKILENLIDNYKNLKLNFNEDNSINNDLIKKDCINLKKIRKDKIKKFLNSSYYNDIKNLNIVKNTNKIGSKIKNLSNEENLIDKLKLILKEIILEWKNFFKELKDCNYNTEKILIASLLFFLNLSLNTIFASICNFFAIKNPALFFTMNLLAIGIVIPFFEESFKRISVKLKCDKEFYIIFNIFEMSSYIYKSILTLNIKQIISTILLRPITAVVLHGTNTIIHELSEKYGNKYDSKTFKILSFILTNLIHMAWNTICIISVHKKVSLNYE